jgi:hypothetical protein
MSINNNNNNNIIQLYSNNNINKLKVSKQRQQQQDPDWISCAKWLDSCNCLPLYLKQRLSSRQLTLSEFAHSLKDGEILCNLVAYLEPDSIDLSQVNKRAQNSQVLCIKNIELFLDACKSPHFNLTDSHLFDPGMLYDLECLPQVIRALSILSKSNLKSSKSNKNPTGFDLISDSPLNNINNNNVTTTTTVINNTKHENQDDIYYNIPPPEELDTIEDNNYTGTKNEFKKVLKFIF